MGSITHVTDASGTVVQELDYDVWGRLRDAATQVVYAQDTESQLFLGRGYTGHEHLLWFGLVNMNARLYDPAVGRFLSPDPYVQAPDMTQNFNRYSYALNNPLKYTDPDGEFFFSLFLGPVGAVIDAACWSAAINGTIQLGKMAFGMQKEFNWAELGSAFVGGLIGGSLGAIAPAFTQANLFVRYTTKALYAGATGMATTGATMLTGDLLDNGKLDISGKDYAKGMLVGGGISAGISLASSAYDFATWDRHTDAEKLAMLNKEYNNKFILDNSIANDAEYRFNRGMTQGESFVRISSKGLATKSMAYSIAEHELRHMSDFATQSLLVKNGMSTKTLSQFINYTEQNATYHQLLSANKHSISGVFWMQVKRYGQHYGLNNFPNTYSIRQILNNIW